MDADGIVSQWTSAIGAMAYTNANLAQRPFYLPDAFGGRGGVVFGTNLLTQAYAPTWLSSTEQTVMKTVFIINRLSGPQVRYGGIFGQSNADQGIRFRYNDSFPTCLATPVSGSSSGNDFVNGGTVGRTYTNGIDVSSIASPEVGTTPFLLTQLAGSSFSSWNASLFTTVGNYWFSQSNPRNYRGEIGELLVYNRTLSENEREQVEEYLMDKWLSGVLPKYNLPEGVAIELSNGGVLNLNGDNHTVATVILGAGGGSVVNGTLTVTDTLVITVNPDGSTDPLDLGNVVFGPNVKLIINGMEYAKGAIDLFSAASLAPLPPFDKENLPKGWNVSYRNGLCRISHGATILILR